MIIVQQGYDYIFKVQYMISTKRMLCLIALFRDRSSFFLLWCHHSKKKRNDIIRKTGCF